MTRDKSKDIAVIGVSARLPGPRELEDWWESLLKGDILTTRLTREELVESGVPEFLANDPDYVPVRGYLSDADRFDAKVLRVSPRDAEMMDPQHRLMLETAWCALEDAGYGKRENRPVTGVFASGSGSGYARTILSQGPLEPDLLEQVIHGTEPDFIASLIAYKLDLTGPAIAVQTACSSSLVGLHLACQALNNGDCEQALVIAAGIAFPQGGHLHIPGGINSGTGVCRPFDGRADGVVEGSGVACVVLRRLVDLLPDSVEPHGIILGTAINNDGATKVGYFAPSIFGQISVIQRAVRNANVDPTSIGYLETHGTGTHIGDPIEWTATSEAYKELGAQKEQISIGALKANVGHLDAASGLASLIKTMKVLKEGKVPPLANFDALNPLMEADGSPLCVQNGREHQWPTNGIRRGAISAFGIGGTNAHVIVEQPPQTENKVLKQEETVHLIQLSAADPEALNRLAKRLSAHLIKHAPNLNDIAYTLMNGRFELPERLVVSGRTNEEIATKLEKNKNVYQSQALVNGHRPVVFLFTGQGSQRPGMAVPFVKTLPGFSDNLSTCLNHFEPSLGETLKRSLLDRNFPEQEINQTEIAQPALFAMEYAIAQSLLSIGMKPAAVAGHSLGEIVAAYFAGVFSLEDAVKFVVERGKSMQSCPEGAMLAVNMEVSELDELLKKSCLDIHMTAINTLDSCVIAGKREEIEAFKNSLSQNTRSTILKTNRAFHSPLIEPALDSLKKVLSKINLQALKIPIALNATGQLHSKGSMLPLGYFLEQAREPVNFSGCLYALRNSFQDPIFIEIGSGQTLSAMAWSSDLEALPINPNRSQDPAVEIMTSIGALWAKGCSVRLSHFYSKGRRIHLPTYPFYGPKWMAPEVVSALKKGFTGAQHDSQLNGNKKIGDFLQKEEKNVRAILLNLWEEILSCDNVNDDSNFFNFGGDSLLITSLIRKVNQSFDIKVPPRKMLAAKTLGDQAALIEEVLAS